MPSTELPDVAPAEWKLSRARLAHVRSQVPSGPWVERVSVALLEPHTHTRFEARGAVAVDPHRALRMMLVGPGGTTAIDLWVTKDRYRLSMPALQIEKRGGNDTADVRELPVGFFRWWFLSPVGGRLLFARSSKAESAWLLRDGDATVSMRSDGQKFFAVRRQGERIEGMEWEGRGLFPRAGARGRYVDGRSGLQVEVLVEDVLDAAPDPAAFADPDAPDDDSSNDAAGQERPSSAEPGGERPRRSPRDRRTDEPSVPGGTSL